MIVKVVFYYDEWMKKPIFPDLAQKIAIYSIGNYRNERRKRKRRKKKRKN
ncbi:hypothetical protein BLA29_014653 [Euroglyphus maynei]|uniref:Uncharacterized protein n=1 Tax=Euroglyphus maynei TaxID=6958 RepID=A0A1Y3BSS9_EURMA|nr:hypothetical protein BLA29_014653 [Euroglyphus maynei]